ncbi:MAG: NAD-dependent epimerase/dehydratase family protein [Deltaproteobacteria bacterium]|nr:NAD-dependent epimerase/dehydratase family protein [Deltaproteobacteria bacterium]
MHKRKILITGAAGFLGYHLASALSEDAANALLLVDNLERGRLDADFESLLRRSNVQFRAGDLTQASTYDGLGEGFDEVYHLAAIIGVKNVLEKPHHVVRVNALTTLLLLEWFVNGGGRKLLFSSTSEAYAWTQKFHALPIPTPEDVPLALVDLRDPRSAYAGSKIFGELAIAQYGRRYAMPFVIVRYHNVYGPRMGMEHVIPQLYERALKGERPLVVYSPGHRRAFCYVADAVRATIAAMRTRAAEGQTFNIGNDAEEVAIGDLATRLLERAHLRAAIEPREAVNDPIVRRCPDLTKARAVLGYHPAVSLQDGLDLTLAWYKTWLM